MRDEFSQKTLDVLAKRVGVRCSNPACRRLTTGPRSDSARIVCTGVGAHITAASPGGARYDRTLTSEQRASAENGIWLCQNHAKLVDNDEVRYTVALLREWKRKAEDAALAELEGGSAHRPEDAAEIELSVGGVEIGSRAPVRPAKHGYDETGYCDRHDYVLRVVIRNLGNERLTGYHVDVEFPAQPLDQPEAHPAYVPGRSSRGRGFFRVSGEQCTGTLSGGRARTARPAVPRRRRHLSRRPLNGETPGLRGAGAGHALSARPRARRRRAALQRLQ